MKPKINVIGAGLAGSEACFYLLNRGYEVHLYERRPQSSDGAHHTDMFGELVCSNSLKSKSLDNACGLLKEEMRIMDSITMQAAAESEVPSGNALSVDRDVFASKITTRLRSFPNLIVHNEEVTTLPEGVCILATGPLTSESLQQTLSDITGSKGLSFFDASAPIVKKSSIDFTKAYYKSRYEQGDESYINCPFNKEEYTAFVDALVHAEKALLHEFDTKYFESCLPVEVIASRGFETLRHGPLKPFGLSTPEHPKPYAVVQLRQDTLLGDYYNLVGFQTNLTYPEQRRVFTMIPGLENAEFLRYGLMHRNTYFDSPRVLNDDLTLKNAPN
nr:methylenetetrahydrofolate--tRNA-(uracil(54)-C(5))-methyltransferase (FADH(2)-oxidizing) TrmFO [Bacilli bacterium]